MVMMEVGVVVVGDGESDGGRLGKTNSMNFMEFNIFKDFPPNLLIFPPNLDH